MEQTGPQELPLNELSIPALAYLGDSVLELVVRREMVLRHGLATAGDLNRAALDYVSASAQSAAMERILPHLTEEEERWFKRGRNSGHLNIPKRATPAEYRRATGMEVLFAYLYLSNRSARLSALFRLAYP
ncbi:MAG TPA: ribonuclease III [Clostridiales bacterium]|nr:ribonuclease III [Clostridiales bacterium]